MRGNLEVVHGLLPRGGSIPACAGEPLDAYGKLARPEVYHSVCGGTGGRFQGQLLFQGLSPRVRGNLTSAKFLPVRRWSIPACAGEPERVGKGGQCWGVYPRVCGGTACVNCLLAVVEGLSPRVRGNPHPPRRQCLCHRSIPACAGEPRSRPGPPAAPRVYPRVCGGTRKRVAGPEPQIGLSPRVRGNRFWVRGGYPLKGSIPVCAGEPA